MSQRNLIIAAVVVVVVIAAFLFTGSGGDNAPAEQGTEATQ